MAIKLYKHQEQMSEFWTNKKKCFNFSEAGTGKTLACIDTFYKAKQLDNKAKMLVIAPLSILETSWYNDCKKYNSDLKPVVITGSAEQRKKLFNSNEYDIYIINHDYVNTITDYFAQYDYNKFSHLIVDECTAFKSHTSNRSESLKRIAKDVDNIIMLSATPINTTVEDLWLPSSILNYKLLGSSVYTFRYKYRDRNEFTNYVKWVDKPEAKEMLATALDPITIKFKLDECVEIPEQQTIDYYIDLDQETQKLNKILSNATIGDFLNGNISINAFTTRQIKKLQVIAGSYYDINKKPIPVSNKRAELIAELVNNRDYSIITYNFTCIAKSIIQELEKQKISYTIIHGDIKQAERARRIADFQSGKYKTILLQENCASHGITLTKAKTIIWSTPTYNYETYTQLNARIKRIGQNNKTNIIRIIGRGTEEENVYCKLDSRINKNNKMLEQFI